MTAAARSTFVRAQDLDTLTIANGQSLSAPIDCGGLTLCGIATPAALTGNIMTFQASLDAGATWKDIYDAAGNEYQVVVGTNRFIPLDPAAFMNNAQIKLRMGAASAPIAQAQDSIFQLSYCGV